MKAKVLVSTIFGATVLGAFPPSIQAQDTKNSAYQLSVSPTTCIVKVLGQPCVTPIKISWTAPMAATFCLYIDNKKKNCWAAQNKVTQTLVLNLRVSSTFELKNDKNQILSSAKVVINAATSKQFRRRLRADWSVF